MKIKKQFRSRLTRSTLIVFAACAALSIFMISLTTVLLSSAHAASADEFVTTWKTDNPGTSNSSSITLPTTGFGYNYDVDWNDDGTFDQFGITDTVTHDFGTPGTYTIRIQGSFPRIYFDYTGDTQKIININQWGSGAWTSMERAFSGASNLTSTATDTPNLTNVTDMSSMFEDATSFNGDLSTWNTSNATNMSSMFQYASSFNSDLSAWDVSNVESMVSMFWGAASFDSDLSAWDVSSVDDLYGMFANAATFTSDLSGWDTGNVTRMAYMFSFARAFTSDLSTWDVSSVVYDMTYMFDGSGLTNEHYDATLSGWSSQPLNPGLTLGVGGMVYCTAVNERQYMIDTFGWIFSGDVNCEDLDNSDKVITSVDFSQQDDRRYMTITGTGMVGATDPNEYADALSRSLVTLNGSPLPFCTYAGATEQLFVDMGALPELVSEVPTCYFLSFTGETIDITPTQATIWLPDDVDITAPGTVSVNGSPTFSFNQPVVVAPTPAAPPVVVNPPEVAKVDDKKTVSQPIASRSPIALLTEEDSSSDSAAVATVMIEGKQLDSGRMVIDARPTFTGKAPVGSKVTVTVHSDPVTCSTIADSEGNWSCTLAKVLPDGDHTVYLAVVTSQNETYNYGPYNVTVGASDNNPTATDQPQENNALDSKKEMSFIPFIVGGGVLAALIASIIIVKRLRR